MIPPKNENEVPKDLVLEIEFCASLLGGGVFLLPLALGGFGDQAALQGAGRHAHITHFTVDDGLDPLQVGHEAPFGNGGDMHTDAALFLGFTTAPDDTALHGGFSG